MSDINEYFINLNTQELFSKDAIVGKNADNKISVLIKSNDNEKNNSIFTTDSLQLKTASNIYLNSEYIGIYHIIICLSEEKNIISDFKNAFDTIIMKNPKKMSSEEVLNLFNSINTIFKTTTEKENRELQIGLFGELIVLKYLYNLGAKNIVDEWHSNFSTKHDIELNKLTRIEIKTTTKEERIHNFKHNQLNRNDIKVYIVSCILESSEKGLSLKELIDQIIELCTDIKKITMLQILKKKCGITDKNWGMIFNENLAYSNLRLYNATDVPQINCEIPDGVMHVTYDVDLSNTPSLNFQIIQTYSNSK